MVKPEADKVFKSAPAATLIPADKLTPEVTVKLDPTDTLPVVVSVDELTVVALSPAMLESPVTFKPDKAAILLAPVTTNDSPTPKLPEKLPIPTTSKALVGVVVPIPTLPLFNIPTMPFEEPIKVFKTVAAPKPLIWNLATGEEVPIPTLELKVSIPKVLPLTLKALVAKVRLRAAVPEVEVKFKAPVDKVKLFWAVKVPPEVMFPLPVAEILPVVEMLSPL